MAQRRTDVKATCRNCRNETQHQILCEHVVTGSTEHIDGYYTNYQIVCCRGCETVAFREHSETTEDLFPGGVTATYPEVSKRSPSVLIPYPSSASHPLREKVDLLYQETIGARNRGLKTLSALGLRAVVEAVCLDQGCIRGTLERKIEDLVAKGVILSREAEYLSTHRLAGNEAAHELMALPDEEFDSALDILEHLLRNIYVLPHVAASLRTARQKRGARVD